MQQQRIELLEQFVQNVKSTLDDDEMLPAAEQKIDAIKSLYLGLVSNLRLLVQGDKAK